MPATSRYKTRDSDSSVGRQLSSGQRDPVAKTGIIIAMFSAAALAGAWAFELVGGYVPCALCLEQRLPYYAAIPLGVAALFFGRRSRRLSLAFLAAAGLALFYNAGLGVYHAGAEWHFWPGPDTCEAAGDISRSAGGLIRSLQNNRPVRCDEAALRILGVSLAGYSVLISAALSLIAATTIVRVQKR